MFKKLLIANRGEIACRIMQSAAQMGIKTIAVYSEVDASARHVRMADEAVLLGAAEAAKSYLNMDAILDAARNSKADAIHPGYGFLSENPQFAEKCERAGFVFVGPDAKSMRAMALKDQAKKLMQAAGVPVTPGYHGKEQDPEKLLSEAKKIGFPVLIKAVAGGGGRGMRKVVDANEFGEQLTSAMRESRSAFGDDRVLIEKFITNPRHIEVQVFGDCHGNAVHFYERDCSVQRRHQKVIEEAPAPGMTPQMRKAMTDAAIKAAKAVSYVNAGTVEFIVDGSGQLDTDKFWFMEMNTRLQVEHPVTEEVTGFDLVELQLRIAAGEELPAQETISLAGHAMEVRLYAEQPEKGFLPSTGVLECFDTVSDNFARLDTGFEAGDEVGSSYDPMLAKLITLADTRENALAKMIEELKLLEIWPVQTNAAFLVQILQAKAFAGGTHDTGFIGAELENLIGKMAGPSDIAAMLAQTAQERSADLAERAPWSEGDGWRLNTSARFVERIQIDGEAFSTKITGDTILLNGQPVPMPSQDDFFHLGISQGLHVAHSKGQQLLFHDGKAWAYGSVDAENAAESLQAGNHIFAPMPGKVLQVLAAAGSSVCAGDVLVVMEAMKMEHSLVSPRDGVIQEVSCNASAQVVEGAVLVTLQALDS